ncbi:uncharacterized protein PSFLO_05319 [Pseudozyma flocculosa]|uniref:F-box domain-containing protein n=1 Tax=Pseudozyma flocculosa TaxID=84751 RepID=A0A5C3F5R1_9BASI|nr:uncharacterized protein PSFLO_05319 [Pseudozyma flocculosa]
MGSSNEPQRHSDVGGASEDKPTLIMSHVICPTLAPLALCFETISLADDAQEVARPRPGSKLQAVLSQPVRLADLVKKIVIKPSETGWDTSASCAPGDGNAALRAPLDAIHFQHLVRKLPMLESMDLQVMTLGNGPLSGSTTSKRRDSDVSTSDAGDELCTKWSPDGIDGLGHLRRLYLSHLSLDGWRMLGASIPSLSNIETLSLDCQFVEDTVLCQIGETCKKLRHLCISTGGTKMTAKGLSAVLEGCYALESLTLVDVEGRLPRDTWSSIEPASDRFRTLRYVISTDGHHHSWVTDHLDSIFASLRTTLLDMAEFVVTRHDGAGKVSGKLRHDFRSARSTDPVVQPRAIPREALDHLSARGSSLSHLNIDFFFLSEAEFKAILGACPNIRTMQVCVDFPFTKLLAKSPLFTQCSRLQELNVNVLPEHCPWIPSDEVMFASHYSLANGHSDASKDGGAPSTPERKVKPDSSPNKRGSVDTSPWVGLGQGEQVVPPKREIRKLARRCPSLRVLRWIGVHGQGEWTMSHGSQQVDFRPFTAGGHAEAA